MSNVVLGKMPEHKFLLTADAGILALSAAMDYADEIGENIKQTVKFIQVPHHGGKHNISTSIMNRMIGNIVEEGETIEKIAYVNAAVGSDHPLQIVVNAFTRRGVSVYKTNGKIIWYHVNMPKREGWTSITKLPFDKNVEEWDD